MEIHFFNISATSSGTRVCESDAIETSFRPMEVTLDSGGERFAGERRAARALDRLGSLPDGVDSRKACLVKPFLERAEVFQINAVPVRVLKIIGVASES